VLVIDRGVGVDGDGTLGSASGSSLVRAADDMVGVAVCAQAAMVGLFRSIG
jgi:hypothetical protein